MQRIIFYPIIIVAPAIESGYFAITSCIFDFLIDFSVLPISNMASQKRTGQHVRKYETASN
jgi:hypothetical protein